MIPDLRPRSATEVVDAGVQLFRRHAGVMLTLAALVAIPQWLIGLVISTAMPAPDATDPLAALSGSVGLLLPGFLILVVWLSLGFGAMVHLGATAYLGDGPDDPAGALRRGARAIRPLFVANFFGYLRAFVIALVVVFVLMIPASILVARSAGGGVSPVLGAVGVFALFTIVVGIFCSELGRVLLATPAVMVENAGGFRALKRGRTLSSGYVGRAAALIFVTVIIGAVISGGALLLASTVLPSPTLASALASVLMLPLYPVIACITVVLYFDLRIRKEGFDIDLLAGDAIASVVPPVA